jgi:hypothetical protein
MLGAGISGQKHPYFFTSVYLQVLGILRLIPFFNPTRQQHSIASSIFVDACCSKSACYDPENLGI